MKGTFELTESGGRVLLRFDNQARLYHWSADFEQAAYTMGVMVAETVSRWSRGELRDD